jgi:hypothetical protein
MAAVALFVAAYFVPTVWSGGSPPAALPPSPPATLPPSPSVSPSVVPSLAATPSASPSAASVTVALPVRGQGTFDIAAGSTPVRGAGGPLRRYQVAVERGSSETAADFARQVDATLGDPRSWIGDRSVRLQRVSSATKPDFTVYLATRETAGRMCLRGGVNIETAGQPYTSCRTTGRAIINLDRWELAAPPYTYSETPLAVYRQYVINHEVGHELGHSHEDCPKAGQPAPVMVQQTLFLHGCRPNAWPVRAGKILHGPKI